MFTAKANPRCQDVVALGAAYWHCLRTPALTLCGGPGCVDRGPTGRAGGAQMV
jgi:hypothetical protein